MPVSSRFLRGCAVCWMVTSLTTLGLIFLPRAVPPAPDLESQARLIENSVYFARLWVGVVHPFFALVGALGVLFVRWKDAAGAASCGFLFFLFWAIGEAVQQSLVLVTLNWGWRADYLAATTPEARAAMATTIASFDALSDGLFLFILIAFMCANVLYAVATWKGTRVQRIVSIFFLLAAGLGALSFATRFGHDIVPAAAMAILYPLIQPVGRFTTGWWLWRVASTDRA